MTERNNLALYRKKKKYSMKELSELTGISQAAISLIESGKRYPALRTARKLSLALDASIDKLFPEPQSETNTISRSA